MTTKEKLIKYIKNKGISKKRFYDITGFSNGFLDSGKYIGTDKLKIILEKFHDLSFEWLILDRGEMLVDSDSIAGTVPDNDYRSLIVALENKVESLNELLEEKERLINEKERLIEILLKK